MSTYELRGVITDIDYTIKDSNTVIRIAFKTNEGSKILKDYNFLPYFYLVPHNNALTKESFESVRIIGDRGEEITVERIDEVRKMLEQSEVRAFRVYAKNPRFIPKLSAALSDFGRCYEYDIVFWKRYIIDRGISPLSAIKATVREQDGEISIERIENVQGQLDVKLSHICFDIETYNPLGVPRMDKDPTIMISYTDGDKSEVFATKRIKEKFVKTFHSESEMIKGFVEVINNADADIIVGYNSSNFDLPYLLERGKVSGSGFAIGRWDGEVRQESHGLMQAFKIPGRTNLDIYNVAKFVSVVGAAEQLIKVNSFKLGDIYNAVTGNTKVTVVKTNIWQLWDNEGEELEELARYSLSDALSLDALYDFFLPLEIEVARASGTTLGEAAISTTGQLVEFVLMRYANIYNYIIPNKPSDNEIHERTANPFEGAYVKTPEAGIYENIVVFDFRGLYPSIIIAHNIDNSTLCTDCEDAFVAPDGSRFRKDRKGVMPIVLKKLIDERNEVKKLHKKNPDDKSLSGRYQALKILANSFYGYMGYARSRWYNRKCAASVTAYGRQFITKVIDDAGAAGFNVIYGDTDSVFLALGNKTRDDAMAFLANVNGKLPEGMELELEDFYSRGVFVGKRGSEGGAKKKYAMLSESGKIKIKGFELVRRDWSKIARDTQRAVLETILKEGDKDKAANIVKEVVEKLKGGKVPFSELAISTQLKKGLGKYDIKSPEVAAASRAVKDGFKKKNEVEGAVISFVITKDGNSISDRARIVEMAENYDPDYYINHQIIPSTLKILKELGYNADELKSKGSQKKLG